MLLITKLLLAHLLGDFIFQPSSWVLEKEAKKWKSKKLYIHAGIHMVLTYLFICTPTLDHSQVFIPLYIFIIHLGIDLLKLISQQTETKKAWFFIDQLLHIISLIAIWYYIIRPEVNLNTWMDSRTMIIITAALLLTTPTAMIIKLIVSQWASQIEKPNDNQEAPSLSNAGKYIGILERLFVFIFILMGQLQAIGFLIAAKSLLRFGNLKNDNERKLTEYVLIGTLLSFGIAIATGIITKLIISAI